MSAIVMAVMGLKPGSTFGYIFGVGMALICLLILAAIGSGLVRSSSSNIKFPVNLPSAFQASTTRTLTPEPKTSVSPLPSSTPTRRQAATHTLIPSLTPSETITPAPTPVWAMINARSMNGAYIREEPKYDGKILTSLLNGALIEVLPDTSTDSGILWAHVRTHAGVEGWIVQSLLVTATPSPDW
jgi:hypothetical protein